MELIFRPEDKPKFGQNIIFAIQQLLAIMAATIAVPMVTNSNAGLTGSDEMSIAAALFGAGVGTLVYVLFTQMKSPVFLGSSFAFLGSMAAAFAGASTVAVGYVGLIIGAVSAGIVYVIISIVVKCVGVRWINFLMPAVVIGPTVSIIGLSLASSSISDLQSGDVYNAEGVATASTLLCVLCGLVALIVVTLCSTYGRKMVKLIPFIIGIGAGYVLALIFTVIGYASGNEALLILDFSPFTDLVANGVTVSTFISVPEFTFMKALGGFSQIDGAYIGSVCVAYVPVAFVVFAEHIADHKNISSIIDRDLLEEPGLHRTLLGDGIGSIAGAVFGGCPNTTYGESVACVAITGNASVLTIIFTAILAIIVSFISPIVALLNSIPSCVMGGVCMALYGFIAVSGLKMLQPVDLNENKNLFTASTILIAGIGGLSLTFGKVTVTSIAAALILGIIVNLLLSGGKKRRHVLLDEEKEGKKK